MRKKSGKALGMLYRLDILVLNTNDPDGIRTRVAAVKGLCPRPLDDRAPPFGNTSKVVDNRVFRQANRGLLVKKTG